MEFDLDRRTLTHLFTAVGAHSFAYATDRTQIAYIQSMEEGEHLNVFDLNTCESTTLLQSNDGQSFGHLDWSPDGETLSFAGFFDDQRGAYTLNVATGEQTRVSESSLGAIWTHDSQPATLVNGTTVSVRGGLHDLSFDGVFFGDATTGLRSRPYIAEMNLSPDGEWLAYETRLRLPGGIETGDLLLSNLSIGGSAALYSGQTNMNFSWSDDNQLVYQDTTVGLVSFDPATEETHHVELCLLGWADSHNVAINWSYEAPYDLRCREDAGYARFETPTDTHACVSEER
jgi:hypothetical protein